MPCLLPCTCPNCCESSRTSCYFVFFHRFLYDSTPIRSRSHNQVRWLLSALMWASDLGASVCNNPVNPSRIDGDRNISMGFNWYNFTQEKKQTKKQFIKCSMWIFQDTFSAQKQFCGFILPYSQNTCLMSTVSIVVFVTS